MKKFLVTSLSNVKVVLKSPLGGTFKKCDICGEYHALSTMEKVDSNYICKTCIVDDYSLCYECNEYHKNDELHDAYNDSKLVQVCEICRDDFYYYCEDCDEYFYVDEIYTVNPNSYNEKYVCNSCIDSYSKCDECGDYFSSRYGYSDDNDNFVCDDCYNDGYRICDCCGIITPIDSLYYDEDSYENYCEQCYIENCSEKLINSYSYKPEPEFFYSRNENRNVLFMGCELEVDGGNDSETGAESVKENLGNHVYNKYDSSLNSGFEIVSHPMSLAYHTSLKSNYRMAFDELSNQGFKSHDTTTCGYHIHVGREYLGCSENDQDYTISKIALMVEMHWDTLVKFSRRKSHELHWCSKFEVTDSYEDLTDIEKINDNCKRQRNRYFALNLQNDNTIEFRLFKGTLKLDTYFACMQLVSNIVEVAKNTSIVDLIGLSFSDIVNYVSYSELTEYCKARKLIEA